MSYSYLGKVKCLRQKKREKFSLAGYSACPAAVNPLGFQIRHFGSNPERGTVSCPLITLQ